MTNSLDETKLGKAYCADCPEMLRSIRAPAFLIHGITSALLASTNHKKAWLLRDEVAI